MLVNRRKNRSSEIPHSEIVHWTIDAIRAFNKFKNFLNELVHENREN